MKFSTLYLELIDSTEMLRALLAGITQDEARVRPHPESWSILETLCHLCDEEREDFREHLDFLVHRSNRIWHPIDPEGWVSARKYNQQSFREVKERFFSERSKSLDWLKAVEGADWTATYTAGFGEISAGDMFVSWVAHDNLAIRQLVELRRARLLTIAEPYHLAYAGDW